MRPITQSHGLAGTYMQIYQTTFGGVVTCCTGGDGHDILSNQSLISVVRHINGIRKESTNKTAAALQIPAVVIAAP